MKSLLRVLFLAALMMPLASCGGEEPDAAEDAVNDTAAAVEEATDAAATTATDAMNTATATATAAETVCCGGSCDAPAGFCHADGTCNGAHAALPIAP